MRKSALLLIGRMPPPVGGVTSFNLQIQALLDSLEQPTEHVEGALDLLYAVKPNQRKNVLLSLSNRPVIFLTAACFRVFGHSVATIIHGDIERGSRANTLIVRFISLISHYTIVLNESSYRYLGHSPTVLCLGTNISQESQANSSDSVFSKSTYITYAHRKEVDSQGRDIYGIPFLYSYFSKGDKKLVIIDPSNSYKHLKASDNIRIYRNAVNVSEFLGPEFIYLRNTSTDGDSLFVHEAMNRGSIVIASDVVSRPPGVLLMGYSNEADLERQLEVAKNYKPPTPTSHYNQWSEFLLQFCSQ